MAGRFRLAALDPAGVSDFVAAIVTWCALLRQSSRLRQRERTLLGFMTILAAVHESPPAIERKREEGVCLRLPCVGHKLGAHVWLGHDEVREVLGQPQRRNAQAKCHNPADDRKLEIEDVASGILAGCCRLKWRVNDRIASHFNLRRNAGQGRRKAVLRAEGSQDRHQAARIVVDAMGPMIHVVSESSLLADDGSMFSGNSLACCRRTWGEGIEAIPFSPSPEKTPDSFDFLEQTRLPCHA